MDKTLDLHACFPVQFLYLTRETSLAVTILVTPRILKSLRRICLITDICVLAWRRQTREIAVQEFQYAEILYNSGVQTISVQRLHIFVQLFFQFPVFQQGIHCEKYFPIICMGIIQRFLQLRFIKILRIRSGSEHAAAQIYSIRARLYHSLADLQ